MQLSNNLKNENISFQKKEEKIQKQISLLGKTKIWKKIIEI
jgi:hypothetical protein